MAEQIAALIVCACVIARLALFGKDTDYISEFTRVTCEKTTQYESENGITTSERTQRHDG